MTLQSGRIQMPISDSTTLTQIRAHVENIRRNYTYPTWFNNTLQWAYDGQISGRELFNAFDNLSSRGELQLSKDPIARPTMQQSFESLYPKQTEQLIKIGQDTTALGDIVTRQDATDAGFRMELPNNKTSMIQSDKNLINLTLMPKLEKIVGCLE